MEEEEEEERKQRMQREEEEFTKLPEDNTADKYDLAEGETLDETKSKKKKDKRKSKKKNKNDNDDVEEFNSGVTQGNT